MYIAVSHYSQYLHAFQLERFQDDVAYRISHSHGDRGNENGLVPRHNRDRTCATRVQTVLGKRWHEPKRDFSRRLAQS